jgi:hypothetical protein
MLSLTVNWANGLTQQVTLNTMNTAPIKSTSEDKELDTNDCVRRKAPTTLLMMEIVKSCPWQLTPPRAQEHYETTFDRLTRMLLR